MRQKIIRMLVGATVAAAAAVPTVAIASERHVGVRSDVASVDAQFLRAMVPHHAVAVSMAEIELRRGHNSEVRKLAMRIAQAQRAEIADMTMHAQRNYGFTPSRTWPGPMGTLMGMDIPTKPSMMPDMLRKEGNVDRAFLRMMIPHHASAIVMANAEVQFGKDAHVKEMARSAIADQAREIGEMQRLLDAGV